MDHGNDDTILKFICLSQVEPNDSKWYLAVGTCQLRSGNYHDALETYRVVHAKFPRDITCLRSLVKLTQDMNLKDAKVIGKSCEV